MNIFFVQNEGLVNAAIHIVEIKPIYSEMKMVPNPNVSLVKLRIKNEIKVKEKIER